MTECDFEIIDSSLKSIMTCISVNNCGTKLICCTENREIIAYILKNGHWECDIKFDSKHDGPILKVKWAPKDFGEIFATGFIKRLL